MPALNRAKSEGWTALDLSHNDIGDKGAKAIAVTLTELSSLNLNKTNIASDGAQAIASTLTNLTSLDLRANRIGTEGAKAVAFGLPNLTSLDLNDNQIGPDGAKAIASNLNHLTSLDLSDNRIDVEGAKAIAFALTKLVSLNLSNSQIGPEGAKAIMNSLFDVTSLSLNGNRIGDAGLKTTASVLTKLTAIDLAVNRIGDNGAKTIAALLPNLTSLNLWNNHVGDEGAKAIASLTPSLTFLDLGNNQIGVEGAKAILDSWRRPHRRLRYLNLQKNGDLSALVPNEILANPEDPAAILAAYRRLAKGEKKVLNEAKLLVVGDEAVGKTSLLRYLIHGKPRDPAEEKTPGIAQERIETERWSPKAGGASLNVWDFGGQEIMRGTHRFFLTARSLYLLVLEDRREDDHSIHEWLKTIRNRAAESPILVVINKSDEGKKALLLDEVDLKQAYPEIVDFMRTSCNDDSFSRDSIQILREKIVDTVAKNEGLKHVRDGFATSWLRIKDEVAALANERAVLPLSEFTRLCETGVDEWDNVADDDERRLLLRLLNDLGTIVAHGLERKAREIDQGITLLDPNWLTSAVYQLLNHPTVRDQQGEFTREQLAAWLNPTHYPKRYHDYILDMMQDEEVGLCFRLPTAQSDERYLIPEALPPSRPDYDGIWPDDTLRFRFQYGYLPPGLIPRFIVEAHRNLTEQKTRWRQGALCEAAGCKILVEAKTASSPKRVDIAVAGPKERQRSALEVILNHLHHVHALNPECDAVARVPLPDRPDADVSYDHLLKLEARYGPNHQCDPEGADRAYTVAELLDGVRHHQPTYARSAKKAARSYNVDAENVTIIEGSVETNGGDLQTGTRDKAASSRRDWGEALSSWRFFSLAAATSAIALALALYLIPISELRFGIAGLATLFIVVYLWVAAKNPECFFRRWIARTILLGLTANFGGVAFDILFISEPATAYLTWNGTVSLGFNIAWPLIVIALGSVDI